MERAIECVPEYIYTAEQVRELLSEAAALAEQVQGPQVPEGFNYSTENRAWPDFGDYVLLEQKRFGVPNEMFVHKVVQRLRSNYWIDVPAVTHNDHLGMTTWKMLYT
jgi:hypothetical protein